MDFNQKQIVSLHGNGKTVVGLAEEYGIARSTVRKWVNDYKNTGSFNARYNRSEEENELLGLRKENKQLRMENDILKRVAVIMSKK